MADDPDDDETHDLLTVSLSADGKKSDVVKLNLSIPQGQGDGRGSLALTSVLQKVDIPMRPNCVEDFLKVLVKPEKQMCAGTKDADSCGGDSGGPLMVR